MNRIHNRELPARIREFYESKNNEIRNARKRFRQMSGGNEPSGSTRDEVQMNNMLMEQAMNKFRNREKNIEIEWMEPNLVESNPPKFSTKRKRTNLDFRYDYWFVQTDSL